MEHTTCHLEHPAQVFSKHWCDHSPPYCYKKRKRKGETDAGRRMKGGGGGKSLKKWLLSFLQSGFLYVTFNVGFLGTLTCEYCFTEEENEGESKGIPNVNFKWMIRLSSIFTLSLQLVHTYAIDRDNLELSLRKRKHKTSAWNFTLKQSVKWEIFHHQQ